MQASKDIFQSGEFREKATILKCPTNALGGNGVWCQALDGFVPEQDSTIGRRHISGNSVEQGCLAGTVWTDDSAYLAGMSVEGHIGERVKAGEIDRYPIEFKERVHGLIPIITLFKNGRDPGQ